MFQISLSSSGELNLHLPGNRLLEISATPTGLDYIKKILYDHERKATPPPKSGYIGTLPTQHAVNKFLREKAARIAKEKADEVRAKANSLGIDLDKLEINI